jgi:hypothetical protein
MKRLASALGAIATLSLLAGCATDDGYYSGSYGYSGGYGYSPYAYGYGYDPYYGYPYYPYGPSVGLGFSYYDFDGGHRYRGDDGRFRRGDGGRRGGRPSNPPPNVGPQGLGPQAVAPQAPMGGANATPNRGNRGGGSFGRRNPG